MDSYLSAVCLSVCVVDIQSVLHIREKKLMKEEGGK